MESLPKEEAASTAERPITPDATQDSSKLAADETASSSVAPATQTKGEMENFVERNFPTPTFGKEIPKKTTINKKDY